MVFDDYGLWALAQKSQTSFSQVLTAFDGIGLNTVAMAPLTPRIMARRQMLTLLAAPLTRNTILTPRDLGDGRLPSIPAYYIYCSGGGEYREYLLPYLPPEFSLFRPQDWEEEDGFLISVPRGETFLDHPLHFYDADIELFTEAGWQVYVRPGEKQALGEKELGELLSHAFAVEGVIFYGRGVWGYPEELALTADYLREENLVFSFIEPFLAQQHGARELGLLMDGQVARLHSIQQGEMDALPQERIIRRYIRAVEERNARILYLRPRLEEDGPGLLEENLALFQDLKHRLEKAGYTVGKPSFFGPLSPSVGSTLLLMLGTLAGALLLLDLYQPHFRRWFPLLFVLGVLCMGVLFLLNQQNFLIAGTQFMITLITPTLALITVLKTPGPSPFWDWLKAALITMGGIVLLIGLSSHRDMLLGLQTFRGVKLALLGPLFLLCLYMVQSRGGLWNLLAVNWFRQRTFWLPFLGLLGFLSITLFVYITRSGNFPSIPVPNWEIWLREFLESSLGVRPRFKEFIWGHPFLLLGLWMQRQKRFTYISLLFLLLGMMGLITMVNSFTHFHTPLWVSLGRTLLGMILGAMGGLLLIGGARIVRRWYS